MVMDQKKLNIILLFCLLCLIIGMLSFVKPENSLVIWVFLLLFGLVLHLVFKLIINKRWAFLRRLFSLYLPIFLVYCLYLLWQNLLGLDLIAYGLSIAVVIEICMRLIGI